MLVLSRRTGEKIVIGNEIVIEILSIGGEGARLGITAPGETSIHRFEVFAEIQEANRAAANSSETEENALEDLSAHVRIKQKIVKRFDWTITLGVGISLTTIAVGASLEGLSLGFLWHPTAALIVGGGTLGAVIVRRGTSGVVSALQSVWQLRLKGDDSDAHNVELAKLAWLSRSARKNGIKAFEDYANTCPDALVSQGLMFLADNAEPEQIKQVLSRRLQAEDDFGVQDSATFEAAGGFAPTFGIIGAVLGLITVLRILDKPEALGIGIATAFIATIYGIGLANILFFPLASRLRERHEEQMKRREEIAVVILSLAAKEMPRAIINKFNLRK